MSNRRWGTLALNSTLGLVLSSTLFFLAPIPLRYLRLSFGRKAYILSTVLGAGLLIYLQQWQWAATYGLLSFLIGTYSECEENDLSLFQSSIISIGLTSAVAGGVFYGVTQQLKLTPGVFIRQQLEPMVAQLSQLPQFQAGFDLNSFILYLPSILGISLMIALFVSLTVMTDRQGKKNHQVLKSFRLPDWMIWVFIGSLRLKLYSADRGGADNSWF